MSKRNTKEGKKARRDARIKRLQQTGIYHPISGSQSAAPRSSKPNKYKPRRNTPKSERPVSEDKESSAHRRAKENLLTVINGKTALEVGLGHRLRRRKGQR